IIEKNVPDSLKGMTVFSLDLTSLVAGTRYRGDFEQRLKNILKELEIRKDVIIFIDEIHMLIGVGSTTGTTGAGDMMKPMLSRGELKCIGATTYNEYRKIFEKEGAMARRFQKVDVREPTIDETIEILKGLKPVFEKHHHVKYSLGALRAAAELSARYLTDRFLPDKAIDIIDETGSLIKLMPKEKQPAEISAADIENVIARLARIPAKNISLSDKEIIRDLEKNLKMRVFGQDEAITTLISTIKLARAGLRDAEKPWGSFLFSGPTGVGKTEVSQQLSSLLNVELIRFDMSEYMERHSVARLIGAPPGYVGYEQGGLLTEAIMKHPYAVVLLDEIEKAHPDIFNILLQVMDNGFLTDNNGRKADFRNTILILTTNAGAFESSRNTMGFIEQDQEPEGMDAIKRMFTPEFRNRLDAVVQFKALSFKIIDKVVEKFISQLQGQLNEKAVILEISDTAKAWLGEKGYDAKMGARPMARAIQEHLKKPLAEEILFGALHNGGVAHVDISKDKKELRFRYSQKESQDEAVISSET
ncbi:MAG: AAA family ATPase, partial [Gammaproteobacteria bacterium]|nr:AAA family ATPase [Gammaproteobacteria bacterium]